MSLSFRISRALSQPWHPSCNGSDEHLVIHDAIQLVDAALVREINDPADRDGIQAAIDFLTDALLSHLSYEEHEIVEPLARLGFYPGQV
jgi:hemerythrin-like domain-containing protein